MAAACNCFLSPHAPKQGQVKSDTRKKWECLHKGYGRILMIAAVVNMSLGAVSAGRNYGSFGVKVSGWVYFSIGFILTIGVIKAGMDKVANSNRQQLGEEKFKQEMAMT